MLLYKVLNMATYPIITSFNARYHIHLELKRMKPIQFSEKQTPSLKPLLCVYCGNVQCRLFPSNSPIEYKRDFEFDVKLHYTITIYICKSKITYSTLIKPIKRRDFFSFLSRHSRSIYSKSIIPPSSPHIPLYIYIDSSNSHTTHKSH